MGARSREKQEKDLFEQFQGAEKNVHKKTKLLIPRIRESVTVSYENMVFLLIAFLISGIICFSLGVEKGRHETPGIGSAGKITVIDAAPAPEARVRDEGYVIQLAAFKTQAPAEREMENLRKAGYSAGVKKSGEFYQLYVGAFKKKEEADRLRERLKAKYNDCYVKKL